MLGGVLKDCADKLAEVFTTIHNTSLSTSWLSACFKAATIFPVPKQSNIICLNAYRPVALTPIPAKCLEWLVIKHSREARPHTLDPHKFAYSKSRSTEDIIATVIYTLLEHLCDVSSAFNSIQPNKLLTKLYHFGLNTILCNLLLDLLTNR